MASGSSSAPTFIMNPTLVEVKDRLRPIFKEVPQIERKEDSISIFFKGSQWRSICGRCQGLYSLHFGGFRH